MFTTKIITFVHLTCAAGLKMDSGLKLDFGYQSAEARVVESVQSDESFILELIHEKEVEAVKTKIGNMPLSEFRLHQEWGPFKRKQENWFDFIVTENIHPAVVDHLNTIEDREAGKLIVEAVMAGHLPLVQHCLEVDPAGAKYRVDSATKNVVLVDLRGDSVLAIAASMGNRDVFDVLANHGADLQYVNPRSGMNIFMHACQGGNLELVSTLLPEFDVNVATQPNALRVERSRNFSQKRPGLVEKSDVPRPGLTALHFAAQGNHPEVSFFLC